jgi:hypothetical protein
MIQKTKKLLGMAVLILVTRRSAIERFFMNVAA